MASKKMSSNQREGLSAQSTVTGQQEYLLSTNGALNTTGGGGGGGGTQYTNGAVAPANPIGTYPVFTNGSGNVTAVSSSNPLPVSASVAPVSDTALATGTITAQDTSSVTTTGANGQSFITGTPTAGSANTVTVSSRETILVEVTGTWTGILMSEGSLDGGATWVSKAVKQVGTAYTANSLTGNFVGAVNVAGLTNYRIRSTATWTGTATVSTLQSSNPHSFYIANNLALRDGTVQSVTNTIKAAAAPATTTDTSLVITENSIRGSNVQQQTTITSSTSETTVLTAVASTFLDVYGCIVVNTSATAVDVIFKDATAGTTRFDVQVPAGDTRGFMLPKNSAHNQAVVNNNWTATCSTSVASIKITMLATKNT